MLSGVSQAGGWTYWATPTQVDVVVTKSLDANAPNVTKGIMIYGSFGNPGNCSVTDRFFVPASHELFAQIYAAVLAANISGKKIRGYVGNCVANPWYAGSETTFGLALDAVNFGS